MSDMPKVAASRDIPRPDAPPKPELAHRPGTSEWRRAYDRRRRDERRTAGLCPHCGRIPSSPGYICCDRCITARRRAYRARTGGGDCIECRKCPPAGGKRRCAECHSLVTERKREARRLRRNELRAAGLCISCGRRAAASGRTSCRSCLDYALATFHRKQARFASEGVCMRCGKQPPIEGFTLCHPCREKTRAASYSTWVRQTADRRARGVCVRCGRKPAEEDVDSCSHCREYCRVASLERWRHNSAKRQAEGLCVRCGRQPAERGTLQCGSCRDKERSRQARGMPNLPPCFTVIEIATGTDHGTWETMQEVAGALAYAKLTPDDVEIIADASPMSAFTGR